MEQPLAKALASAGTGVRRFYKGRDGRAWTKADAAQLDEALAQADRHALDPGAFERLLSGAGLGVNADVARTRAALAYADALANGLVDPNQVFGIYTLPRPAPNLVRGLSDALGRGGVRFWLDTLAPRDTEYTQLGEAFRAERADSSKPQPPPVPTGPVIRPGDQDARMAALAARLGVAQDASDTYSPALAATVQAFQSTHGLKADGVVGTNTLTALNLGPRERATALALALERRRWLVRDPPHERIDVNTAACTLVYWRDGEPVHEAKVVCGRAGHETPQLQADFGQLVVNPPWHVPRSIARAEIDPKGSGYLARHHMRRWKNGRIVQEPGPWAALGQVKFDMQDRYAIYLHDTPSKSLFARSQRHMSHGCVRVEGAVEFARMLAKSAGQDAAFDRQLESGDTGPVALAREIPVRLLYHPVSAGPDGSMVYRSDVYGWDVRLSQAMGLTDAPSDRGEAPDILPLGP